MIFDSMFIWHQVALVIHPELHYGSVLHLPVEVAHILFACRGNIVDCIPHCITDCVCSLLHPALISRHHKDESDSDDADEEDEDKRALTTFRFEVHGAFS